MQFPFLAGTISVGCPFFSNASVAPAALGDALSGRPEQPRQLPQRLPAPRSPAASPALKQTCGEIKYRFDFLLFPALKGSRIGSRQKVSPAPAVLPPGGGRRSSPGRTERGGAEERRQGAEAGGAGGLLGVYKTCLVFVSTLAGYLTAPFLLGS